MESFSGFVFYVTGTDNHGGAYAGADYTVYAVLPPHYGGSEVVYSLKYEAHRGSNCPGRYHLDGFDQSRLRREIVESVWQVPEEATMVTQPGLEESYRKLFKQKHAELTDTD